MRFILSIVIWFIFVGGLWLYISQRDASRQQTATVVPIAPSVVGNFSIEITPTFSTEKDPFALTTENADASSFELKLNGTPIVFPYDELQRGKAVVLENIEGLLNGHNEIYVKASPPLSENTLEHGIRIKLFEEDSLLVDKTIWSSQGALVSGTISFNHLVKKEDGHDH
ncbi:MAG: hypothetical protein KJO32_08395 [Deltaproteobacteria bacterium]|nr:hypothetical protein [Deltaproteobacteria bacterium]